MMNYVCKCATLCEYGMSASAGALAHTHTVERELVCDSHVELNEWLNEYDGPVILIVNCL